MKLFAPRHAAIIVVLAGLLIAINLAIAPRRRAVQTKNCQINLKQIGLATMQYVRDYDEKFPLAANWAEGLKPYAIGSSKPNPAAAFDKMFHCPTTGSFYAYNRHLEIVSIGMITGPMYRVPLAIEVNAGNPQINLNGAGELWPSSSIHEMARARGNHVLFADGHVKLTNSKPTFRSFATPTPKPTKVKPNQTAKP